MNKRQTVLLNIFLLFCTKYFSRNSSTSKYWCQDTWVIIFWGTCFPYITFHSEDGVSRFLRNISAHFPEDSNSSSEIRFGFVTQDSRHEKIGDFATNRQKFLDAETGRNPSGSTEGRDLWNGDGVLHVSSYRDFDLYTDSSGGNSMPKAMNISQKRLLILLSFLPFLSSSFFFSSLSHTVMCLMFTVSNKCTVSPINAMH